MAFTETFGGTTIYPSDVSYRAISLSANQELSWPLEVATSGNVVAQIMDVTPSASGFTITMPPANEASPGETALFFNAGSFNFTVADNAGNTIVTITPGLAYQVYLRTNTTVAGTWRTTQFGAGTSSATAGSLVGAGIKAINTTLNQSMAVTSLSVNYTAGAADRSAAFLWTGGAGTITLPAASTVGNDWFFHIRNGGTGAISLATTGGELINGTATVDFNPGDSAIIVCDGTGYFTIGFGQAPEFLFDYVSIDLTSQSSPYTLAGSNLNRIAYQFSGTLTTNMQIIVPATIQQYWVGNFTTGGSYTVTVKTSAGTGVIVPRDARAILYCNGTDVVTADTGGISIPILVSQGGTGATNASQARTNLGATSIGNALFIAADEATARNAIIAAKSGANSDITSLSGLTTPLSVAQGGTGVATFTANGLVYGAGTSSLSVTAAGTTGQVLVGNTGSAPSWATLSGIGVTTFSAGTTGLTPSSATSGAITLAGTLIVANGGTGATTLTGYVKGSGTSALTASATIPATDISGGAALTKTDDTNVTLTLGGTPASALLAATSLTLGWSGQLSVARGGTGQSSYTDGQLLIGNSTGNTLTKATLTAGTNVTITNGSGAITINAADQFVGTVTSVSGTGTVSGLTLTGTVTTSGNLTLGGTLAVTASDFASQTAKTFLAAPNASAGVPSFRAIIPADVPTLNQNTTGTASNVTGTVAVANGGTGTTTAFTAGSVVFAGASGVYSQDNANLFWDDTNNRLGIGTAAPLTALHVQSTASNTTSRVTSALTGSLYYSGYEVNRAGTAGGALMRSARNAAVGGVGWEWLTTADNAAELAGTYTSGMTLDNYGSLGIGTSSPTARLTVSAGSVMSRFQTGSATDGRIEFAYNTTDIGYLNMASATQLELYGRSGVALAFGAGGSERMRITSAGDVGIGTSSPAYKLDVSGTFRTTGTAYLGDATTTLIASIGNSASSGVKIIQFSRASGTGDNVNIQGINTGIGAADIGMQVSGGNVGIGTASPGAKLHVLGSEIRLQNTGGFYSFYDTAGTTRVGYIQNATGNIAIVNEQAGYVNIYTSNTERMRIDSSGNVGIGTSTITPIFGRTLQISDGTVNSSISLLGTGAGTTGDGYLAATADAFSITARASTFLTLGTNDTERMRITSAGDVGIGTTVPGDFGRFAVVGSASGAGILGVNSDATRVDIQSYNKPLSINRQGNNTILNEVTGDVGVGTTSTAAKLHVLAIGNIGTFESSSALSVVRVKSTAAEMALYTNTGEVGVSAVGAYPLLFKTQDAERMRIDSSGNVGIGTTSPADKLTVNGFITTTAGAYSSTNGGNAVKLGAAGQMNFGAGGSDLILATNAGNIRFGDWNTNTERMRIDTSGNLLVGTTTSSSSSTDNGLILRGDFPGYIVSRRSSGSGQGHMLFVNGGAAVGDITSSTTATSYNTSSDYRLKDIDGPVADSGAYIDALKPVQGSWKADGSRFIGLLAHEVQEVSETPIATGEKDGEKMQAMDYSAPELIANLIAEIQSLRARVAQLEGN